MTRRARFHLAQAKEETSRERGRVAWLWLLVATVWLGPTVSRVAAGGGDVWIPEPRATGEWTSEERAVRRCVDRWIKIATRRFYPDSGWGTGWASRYSLDLSLRHGEGGQPIPDDVICLKESGSVSLGQAVLMAYTVTGETRYLETAKEVGQMLLVSQTQAGGWGVEVWLGMKEANSIRTFPGIRSWPADDPPDKIRGNDVADLDENNTADASEFLYRLWWITRDDRFLTGWRKAVGFFLVAQAQTGGGFPESYPADDYRKFASFSGQTTSTAVQILRMAYERTGERKYLNGMIQCADWMVSVRDPGKGWGLRYDSQGTIVSGRNHEPAAYCTEATMYAIVALGLVAEYSDDTAYLDAMNDASQWLRGLPAARGSCAKFYDRQSHQPVFLDGEGKPVRNPKKARRGYQWLGPWCDNGINLAAKLVISAQRREAHEVPSGGDPSTNALIPLMGMGQGEQAEKSISQILSSQKSDGTWHSMTGSTQMLDVRPTVRILSTLCGVVAKQRLPEAPAPKEKSESSGP